MEEGDSLLALACSSGYFELARVLLAMGANVDDRGSKGDLTPLMDGKHNNDDKKHTRMLVNY
jgi:ankyrin repeat protein